MSMLSVPVKDLNEKTTIDNNTYVVCGNTEANKISYENLVKPLRDELNSTMKVNKISLGTKCGVTATCYYNDFMCEIYMEGKTTGTFTAWTGYKFDRLPLAKLYPGRDIVEYFPYHTEFYMEITPGGFVNMNAKQNVSTTGISVQCSKVFMLAN